MLGFCNTLEKLPGHIKQHGLDQDAEQAAGNIHRYFSTAALLHHQDEEQDLFPLLIGQSSTLAEIIHGLKQEHERLEAAWKKIEPALKNPGSIGGTTEFGQWLDEFCTLYRAHILKEEEKLLSTAQRMLSPEQLDNIGKNMQERRQKAY